MAFNLKQKKGNKSAMPSNPARIPFPEPPFPSGMEVSTPEYAPALEAPRIPKPVRMPVKAPELPGVGAAKPRNFAAHSDDRAATEAIQPQLFIKLDKYRDIVRNIQDLKSYALSLRDAVDALSDIEKEMKNAIDLANKTLDKFNTMISAIDARFSRPNEGEVPETPHDMDNYIKDMYDQLEKIRHELRTIESDSGT
jgi:hypothetical protein